LVASFYIIYVYGIVFFPLGVDDSVVSEGGN